MKNLVFILTLLSFGVMANAQIKGVNIYDAKNIEDCKTYEMEDLDGLFIKNISDKAKAYIYLYDYTAVQYKHAVYKLYNILDANGIEGPPDYDDSLIPDYVDNEYLEYSDMATALVVGSAEIWQEWIVNDHWIIRIRSLDSFIAVGVVWYNESLR